LPKLLFAGQPLILKDNAQAHSVQLGDQRMSQVVSEGFWMGIVPLYTGNRKRLFITRQFVVPASWSALLEHPRGEFFVSDILIHRKPLSQANSLRLPTSVWKKVGKQADPEKAQQKKKMREILSAQTSDWAGSCWHLPLKSKVVSRFGSPRTLPNGKSYYHTGQDLRARSPQEIVAVADGRVVLAEHMVVPGNVVVIDHGLGVFSRYMHLSEFRVSPGSRVSRGQVIALTGGTGRVEAPHLHWEIVWKGNPGSPEKFVQALAPFCDQGSNVAM
jgi:murein DD-endopeptidase MepM/ murein hydrolase activator NlpD